MLIKSIPKKNTKTVVNPYEKRGTSDFIIEKIHHYLYCEEIELKKKFYDLEVI
jgi:hypothetical protein